MNIREQALEITGASRDAGGDPASAMLGILSMPAAGMEVQRTAIVIVVGGAQYRVGSHRQFVRLARRLAGAGHPVLRFDLPGMGDSPGASVPFEQTAPHIGAAIDATVHASGAHRIVLWGLCDGASASLLYLQARRDARVAGLVLLNPWVRSEAGLARTRVKHYYRQRLLEPAFWRKLWAGGVGLKALRDLGRNLRSMRRKRPQSLSFQELMALAWQGFEGKTLLILSTRDVTAQEFAECLASDAPWRQAAQRPTVTRHDLQGADHTCSQPASQQEVEALTLRWLATLTR